VEPRTCVLLAGGGSAWEPAALGALESRPGVVVLKRCLDLTDLLAQATTGQAGVAVLALDLPGLDAAAVTHLARHGVQAVGVVPPGAPDGTAGRAAALGVPRVVAADRLAALPEAVLAVARDEPEAAPVAAASGSPTDGPVVTVWGPTGAPGRTTVALGLGSELARRGRDPLVLDVDPWGGTVAQHLGVLDEVAGLLAAARLAGGGRLPERFGTLQRRVGGLRVLTGLPRADRWTEVRAGTVEELVRLGRAQGPVVVDAGFCLEEDAAADHAGRPGRTAMTLAAVAEADLLVAVGTADPVGLSRLARGLGELRERSSGRPVHVVVNRWRPRLGWSASDVAALLRGFDVAGLHLLPDDPRAADRALLTGRTLAEVGDSALATAVSGLVDATGIAPGTSAPSRRRSLLPTRARVTRGAARTSRGARSAR
jgi:MinD-like ATPase involved in chromosome partitioning or flagellar assembly